MKKIFTISLPLLLSATAIFAQQDPQFSQFMYNKLFMNPGYAGMTHSLCFTGIARQQWIGFDGSPKSGVFSADTYLTGMSGGVGLNVLFDQLGFENNFAIRGNYSFHRTIGFGEIGFGVEVGSFSKRLGPTGIQQWQSTTNWQSDPNIPPQVKKTVMDFGTGIWYQNARFWGGISATHLNGKTIDDGTQAIPQSNSTIVTHQLIYQMARHYFVTGGAVLTPGPMWEIRPSFLIKSDATVTSFDLDVNAMFNHRFWVGASYRINDAICPMIGYQWTRSKSGNSDTDTDDKHPVFHPEEQRQGTTMKCGIAYDYTLSHLSNYNSGTIEVFLNYCVPLRAPKDRGKAWDTREGNW
jgi:type IX secretion system PorP/SprF family membrane protein